jgi:hypothetical protein
MVLTLKIPVKTFHTNFCPCYVLDSRLHNAGSIGPPKWEPRSYICIYLGHFPCHAGIVALVYNPFTGHVSPQYHVVFDDDFTTVPYMEAGTIPPHWSDLLQSSSQLASKQVINIAQAWLGSTGLDNTDLQFTDNPVIDPFAIVTDHHNSSITKSAHLDQETNNITYQKLPSMTMVLPQTIVAVSKGGTLTLGSKRSLITADDSVLPASQAATITSQGRDTITATIYEPLVTQSVDDLKLPPRLNLRESGLRQSERVKALQQKAHGPGHIALGTRTKRYMSALITLFSFVGHVTVPDHELPTLATLSDHMIKRFEELNEHYNGTMNQIHVLSFSTDVSSNEVLTYKEAITQEDAHLFVEAMQKELAGHELRNHWTIVHCSPVPRTTKPIQAIWSFKHKQCPDGTLVEHKARLCAHGGIQQWGKKLLGNILTSGKYGNSTSHSTACQNIQT